MVAYRLGSAGVRLRRCKRTDAPVVAELVGRRLEVQRRERFYRRMLADLRCDVYIAEDSEGRAVGLVALAYQRSLAGDGFCATLDEAVATGPRAAEVLAGLVSFAEARARKRGCRLLVAPWGARSELREVLRARGYEGRESLVSALEPAAG